jgi:hypothetical protein
MMAARVAGVPRPCFFSASFNSSSSTRLPAVSIAPRWVLSVKGFSGVVSPRRTNGSWGPHSPGRNSGRSCSSSLLSSSFRGYSMVHPGSSTRTPLARNGTPLDTPETLVTSFTQAGYKTAIKRTTTAS